MDLQITELIEEFINIWINNCNMTSIQPPEFDKFIKIIDKLRKKSKLEIEEKKTFIELIELMANTIYTINNFSNKYESKYRTNYYQQSKKYEEPELNCCSNLLNNLESEIYWDLENKYDLELTKTLDSNKSI